MPMSGCELLQPPGRLDAVHQRHPHVHQHDVGREVVGDELERLRARAGLAHHHESSVSSRETSDSRNPVLSSTTSTRTRLARRLRGSPRSQHRPSVIDWPSRRIRQYDRVPVGSPIWGTAYVSSRADDSRPRGRFGRSLPVPAASLLCSAQTCSPSAAPHAAPSEIDIVEEAREPPPAGPRNPRRAASAGNASAGEGRIGCAMTRATQCAAAYRRLRPGTHTDTAAAPHAGATPHVLPHARPPSRSLAPSEEELTDEPRQPGRDRTARDQRRPSVRPMARHPAMGARPERGPATGTGATGATAGRPGADGGRGGRGRSRSGAGAAPDLERPAESSTDPTGPRPSPRTPTPIEPAPDAGRPRPPRVPTENGRRRPGAVGHPSAAASGTPDTRTTRRSDHRCRHIRGAPDRPATGEADGCRGHRRRRRRGGRGGRGRRSAGRGTRTAAGGSERRHRAADGNSRVLSRRGRPPSGTGVEDASMPPRPATVRPNRTPSPSSTREHRRRRGPRRRRGRRGNALPKWAPRTKHPRFHHRHPARRRPARWRADSPDGPRKRRGRRGPAPPSGRPPLRHDRRNRVHRHEAARAAVAPAPRRTRSRWRPVAPPGAALQPFADRAGRRRASPPRGHDRRAADHRQAHGDHRARRSRPDRGARGETSWSSTTSRARARRRWSATSTSDACRTCSRAWRPRSSTSVGAATACCTPARSTTRPRISKGRSRGSSRS